MTEYISLYSIRFDWTKGIFDSTRFDLLFKNPHSIRSDSIRFDNLNIQFVIDSIRLSRIESNKIIRLFDSVSVSDPLTVNSIHLHSNSDEKNCQLCSGSCPSLADIRGSILKKRTYYMKKRINIIGYSLYLDFSNKEWFSFCMIYIQGGPKVTLPRKNGISPLRLDQTGSFFYQG